MSTKTKPRFRDGARVYYNPKKQLGTVLEILNADDPADRALQGWRYIVRLEDRTEWSILENQLTPKNQEKETANEKATTAV
jgi:hypothetical protein